MSPAASRIPRHRREDALAWAVALASLALVLWAHASLMAPPALLHLSDEGYIQAIANRMLDGRMLPYVDGVGHRGPLLYWVAAVATALLGRDSWAAMRVLGCVTMSLTALGAFVAARAARRPFAGAAAALAVAFVGLVAMYPADGMSYNGEYLCDVFAMAGLGAVTVGLSAERRRLRIGLVALAGVCASLGTLSKQSGAVLVPTLGMWVLAAALSREGLHRRQRGLLLLAFVGGVAAPLVLLVLAYAAADELEALVYYGWSYNVEVYMQTLTGELKRAAVSRWLTDRAVLFVAAGALVLWGLRRPLSGSPAGLLRRWDSDGFAPTVALGALLSLLACNATLRGFWHYYVLVVPWFGCLAGLLLDGALPSRQRGPRRAAWQRSLVVAPVLLVVAGHWALQVDTYREAQRRIRQQTAAWCRTLDEHAPPAAPLFVWGFRPDLYVWCDRKPASRFVYTTFVAGFVPWATWMTKDQEDRFASPGARTQLLAELEAAQPPVILDAGASLAGRSMLRYERLATYLRQHYREGEPIDGMPLWVRR